MLIFSARKDTEGAGGNSSLKSVSVPKAEATNTNVAIE
jgi:hypothetical protein